MKEKGASAANQTLTSRNDPESEECRTKGARRQKKGEGEATISVCVIRRPSSTVDLQVFGENFSSS